MKYLSYIMVISFVLITLLACEPEPEELFIRHFSIERGEHYSTPRLIETLQSNRLVFSAKFDETAKYDLKDVAMQSNKNKLMGFSDCNSQHHENSARFAWQWYNDRLEIFAYCYVNGNRVEQYVGTVSINEVNHYEILLTDTEYLFFLNGESPVRIDRGNTCSQGIYYMLWPYFGGSLPAPQKIAIDIAIDP